MAAQSAAQSAKSTIFFSATNSRLERAEPKRPGDSSDEDEDTTDYSLTVGVNEEVNLENVPDDFLASLEGADFKHVDNPGVLTVFNIQPIGQPQGPDENGVTSCVKSVEGASFPDGMPKELKDVEVEYKWGLPQPFLGETGTRTLLVTGNTIYKVVTEHSKVACSIGRDITTNTTYYVEVQFK